MQLGDARTGKLADNLTGFGRALRRAGVPADSARLALAQQAAMLVGVGSKDDLGAALEAVLVSREQDRLVFRELFDAYFRNPEIAKKLLAQMLPKGEGRTAPDTRRPRVNEALRPPQPRPGMARTPDQNELQLDAAMTASTLQRLRQADFSALSGQEFHLVETLARDIPLPLPQFKARRTRPCSRGPVPDWPGTLRRAVRHGGELMQIPGRRRVAHDLPLLVLADVSGSMERYARLLLAFLHAATRGLHRRDVFAFGTGLTDLTPSFSLADTDAMLLDASARIPDFAGGTRLGDSLHQLHQHHARRLVGRRTLVLLITDGLDTGEPADLAPELAWLRRAGGRLLWLNPLLRYAGYAPTARGASVLHQYAHGMLAVHNLEKLEDLARSLAQLMRTPTR